MPKKPAWILVKIVGAAMNGKVKIPEDQYGKNISIDYHIGTEVHKCVFEYRKNGVYYLIAILPYAKGEI